MISLYLLSILIDYLDYLTFLKLKDILPDYLKTRYYEKEIGLYNLDSIKTYDYLYQRSFPYSISLDYFELLKVETPLRIFQYCTYGKTFCFISKDNKIMRYRDGKLFEIDLEALLQFIKSKEKKRKY